MIPNLRIDKDSTTAANGASTWSAASGGQTSATYVQKGTATDMVVATVFNGSASSAASGSQTIAVTVYGSASTGFATSTLVAADKSTTNATTAASNVLLSVLHFAQLQYPYYKFVYTPGGNVTGQAQSVAIFSGLQDSLDNTVQ